MITAEQINNVNKSVKKIEVKGKNYVCVAARVAAFRQLCPEGSIQTSIVNMGDGVVTMQTTVSDETGRVLATGMAQEKEASSYINKTSYIENCETSAVGRALGMLGIGSDEQMASAEEMVNALNNQTSRKPRKEEPPKEETLQQAGAEVGTEKITQKEADRLKAVLSKNQMRWFLAKHDLEKPEDATVAMYAETFQTLNEREKNGNKGQTA